MWRALAASTRIIQSGSDALVTRALAGCAGDEALAGCAGDEALAGCVGDVAVSQSWGQCGSGAAGAAREAHADRICTRG